MRFLKHIFIIIFLLYCGIGNAKKIEKDGIIYATKGYRAVVSGVSSSLKNIKIPLYINIGGVSYLVSEIGKEAFKDHFYIEQIIIPNSVTVIGYRAFCHCPNLRSLILPDKTTVHLSDPYFSKSRKCSPVEGCINLTDIKGNCVTYPEYFESHLNYNIKDVPFFNSLEPAPYDNMNHGSYENSERHTLEQGLQSEDNTNNKSARRRRSVSKETKENDDNLFALPSNSLSEETPLLQMLTGKTAASSSSGSDKPISSDKKSHKSIKTITDNAKNVSGKYWGVGVLTQDGEIIEQYNEIVIAIKRIDRNNVGINVYENGEIPFFNKDIAYKVTKISDGYELANDEISSAIVKILDGGTLRYIHPRVNIEDSIYQLSILVGKENVSKKGDLNENSDISAIKVDFPEEHSFTVKSHVVQPGETFASIAKKYNVNVENLKEWNEISSKIPASSKPPKGTELLIYVE